MSSVPQFDLYMRSNCHLCEDMLEMLIPYQQNQEIQINLIDVDSSDALREKYGLKVPVLEYQETEICHYYFDQHSFLSILKKL